MTPPTPPAGPALDAPTVVHVREGYDLYIGRAMPRQRLKASDWANPYKITEERSREDVLAAYEIYLTVLRPDLLARLGDLTGQRLGCWCAPAPCHGNVLIELWWKYVGQPIDSAAPPP